MPNLFAGSGIADVKRIFDKHHHNNKFNSVMLRLATNLFKGLSEKNIKNILDLNQNAELYYNNIKNTKSASHIKHIEIVPFALCLIIDNPFLMYLWILYSNEPNVSSITELFDQIKHNNRVSSRVEILPGYQTGGMALIRHLTAFASIILLIILYTFFWNASQNLVGKLSEGELGQSFEFIEIMLRKSKISIKNDENPATKKLLIGILGPDFVNAIDNIYTYQDYLSDPVQFSRVVDVLTIQPEPTADSSIEMKSPIENMSLIPTSKSFSLALIPVELKSNANEQKMIDHVLFELNSEIGKEHTIEGLMKVLHEYSNGKLDELFKSNTKSKAKIDSVATVNIIPEQTWFKFIGEVIKENSDFFKPSFAYNK